MWRSPAASASADVWTEYAPRCSGYRCGTADPNTKVAPSSSAPSNVSGVSLFSKIASSPFDRRSPAVSAPFPIATHAIS